MDDLIGRKIGPYEVRGLIGRGGMASVYRAYDALLNRYVAIKVLPPFMTQDEHFVARFFQEALAAGALSHPNILGIYDADIFRGQCYIVMDYVTGGTLADRMQKGPMPPDVAAELIAQIAEALDYAHRRGIVHRDIKPSNILLDEEGRPLLADFGIAQAMTSGPRLTQTNTSIGTPEYMSPEQSEGHRVDGRSDLYSLGIVLYQMLTGRVPFQGHTPVATLYQVVHQAPPPIRPLAPHVPEYLESVVPRALAKSPEARFQTGREMAAALRGRRPVAPRADPSIAGTLLLGPARQRKDAPVQSTTAASVPAPCCAPPPVSNPRNQQQPRKSPEMPCATIDPVHFSVSSPPTVRPGAPFLVDVWAHLGSEHEAVVARARAATVDGQIVIRERGPVKIARGTVLTVALAIEGLVVEDPEDVLMWEGEIGNVQFRVRVPEDARPGCRAGTARIFANGLQIARLCFDVEVGQTTAGAQDRRSIPQKYATAFASYASKDRDAVLGRIQGMLKVVPQLKVFVDVVSLRSGQDWGAELMHVIPASDVFYLFWSENARQSEWVEREWRCALQARGRDFIDPVPLVAPDVVPPPPELSGKHFNDWVLAFMRAQSVSS